MKRNKARRRNPIIAALMACDRLGLMVTYHLSSHTAGHPQHEGYPAHAVARAALDRWDGRGEPQGWHRHPASGRRRPDGDPAQEHVNP